jgi:hypothetical protein
MATDDIAIRYLLVDLKARQACVDFQKRCRAAAGCAWLSGAALAHSASGVDPLSWTPEHWGRRAPDEESTCREPDRLTRPNFARKRLS